MIAAPRRHQLAIGMRTPTAAVAETRLASKVVRRLALPAAGGPQLTLTTIKTLFTEASACAYPGCDEPLIFHDRGKTTVVAEIVHIRSEVCP